MAFSVVRLTYWLLILKLHVSRFFGLSWKSQNLLGREFKFSSAERFVETFRKVFVEERYFFRAQNNTPVIIDCGSSFGLSSAYFRRIYPGATILPFETKEKCFPLSQFVRKPIDLIKLDFTGSEAEVLEELATSSRMAMVREMIIEFRHDLERDQSLPVVLKALRTYQVKFQSDITDESVQDMIIQAKRRPHVSVKSTRRTAQLTF